MVRFSNFPGCLLLSRQSSSSPRVEGMRKSSDDRLEAERPLLLSPEPLLFLFLRLFGLRLLDLLLRPFLSSSFSFSFSRLSSAFFSSSDPTDPRRAPGSPPFVFLAFSFLRISSASRWASFAILSKPVTSEVCPPPGPPGAPGGGSPGGSGTLEAGPNSVTKRLTISTASGLVYSCSIIVRGLTTRHL